MHQPRYFNRNGICFLKLLSLSLLTLLALAQAPVIANAAQDDADRRRAFQLYKDGKYTDALPIFEKLAAANPSDREVVETFGVMLVGQAAYLKDEAARKDARKRGREMLLKAQQLGSESDLVKAMLASVPPDGGGDTSFSPKAEVDEAMREGEAAFAKGDLPKALEFYQRALLLDPKLYEAALFIGDVYFKSAEQRKAGEWFAKAVEIDPDRETAYRYWGDSLMKQGRVTDAGNKFIEAYIAEPYNRLAQSGLATWGQRVNIPVGHPRVNIPANVTSKQDGHTTLTIDPKTLDDKKGNSGAAWMTYGLIRAGWKDQFAKQYPNETTYRHSLKEETAAMRAAIKILGEKKGDDQTADPSLLIISKLDKEGLLESFILLAIPDRGIIQDFAVYRKTNIDNLRKYVNQYVLTGGGTK